MHGTARVWKHFTDLFDFLPLAALVDSVRAGSFLPTLLVFTGIVNLLSDVFVMVAGDVFLRWGAVCFLPARRTLPVPRQVGDEGFLR